MTLSFNKFTLDSPFYSEGGVAIRCKLCESEELYNSLRLDDAIEWAESHDCSAPRLTAP